jgi:spore coat polysaccharide biosynthesis predicted glycosyltransferase SpsG
MEDFMLEADISIGAGGTTSWERCCLGLPTIVISLAENQEKIVEVLEAENAILYLGRKTIVEPEIISESINKLINKPTLVFEMSRNALKICDGKGCARVVKHMKECLR